MPSIEEKPTAFGYVAQTNDGQPITGTIDAAAVDEAGRKLEALHLRVIELKPVVRPPRARALGQDDFLAFNQQLAQLATAGLPIEHGLRLIADDMRRGRLARSLNQIAGDLESGKSLPQAIELHRGQFPPLYSRLVDAGVRCGNLSGTLLNLGHHITLLRQLRATIWRTAAYPVSVLLAAFAVLVFLSYTILPQFQGVYGGFHTVLPTSTLLVMQTAAVIRSHEFWTALWSIVAIAAVILLALRYLDLHRTVMGRIAIYIPLIAPVIRRSLTARWCDAVRVGIEAGLDLPGAIQLAGDIVGSPNLRADGQTLIDLLNAGGSISAAPRGSILPLTVVCAIQLAIDRGNLSETLASLSLMYQQQAEGRIATVQAWLAPFLLLLVGGAIFFIILAIFAPFFSLMQAIAGPHFFK